MSLRFVTNDGNTTAFEGLRAVALITRRKWAKRAERFQVDYLKNLDPPAYSPTLATAKRKAIATHIAHKLGSA